MLPKFRAGCTQPLSKAHDAMKAASGNIFLIGPMGSGKTTIGQRLANLLGLHFLDCDHELEAHTGASVSLIFEIEGEQGFRERESRMLDELSARKGVLIATGGGTVIRPENRKILRERGLVVYLKTPVSQQIKRLRRDKSRPLLQTDDRKEKLLRLAAERDPLYASVADIEFPARNRSLDVAAEKLAEAIREYGNRP